MFSPPRYLCLARSNRAYPLSPLCVAKRGCCSLCTLVHASSYEPRPSPGQGLSRVSSLSSSSSSSLLSSRYDHVESPKRCPGQRTSTTAAAAAARPLFEIRWVAPPIAALPAFLFSAVRSRDYFNNVPHDDGGGGGGGGGSGDADTVPGRSHRHPCVTANARRSASSYLVSACHTSLFSPIAGDREVQWKRVRREKARTKKE